MRRYEFWLSLNVWVTFFRHRLWFTYYVSRLRSVHKQMVLVWLFRFLEGAWSVDYHFKTAPLEDNFPVCSRKSTNLGAHWNVTLIRMTYWNITAGYLTLLCDIFLIFPHSPAEWMSEKICAGSAGIDQCMECLVPALPCPGESRLQFALDILPSATCFHQQKESCSPLAWHSNHIF